MMSIAAIKALLLLVRAPSAPEETHTHGLDFPAGEKVSRGVAV